MTGSFGAKLKLEKQKAEIRISQFQPAPKAQLSFVVPISQFLLFPTDGGGIPRPAFNPYILYQFSMLYDSIVASMLYSASFEPFCGETSQVPFHEHFTRTTSLFKSSPVKANQG